MALTALRDVRQRHLRFLAGVRALRRVDDPGLVAVVDAGADAVLNRLRQFELQLSFVLSERANEPTDPTQWSDIMRESIADLTRTAFDALSEVQLQIFPYLPLDSRPPADIGFFLARCVGRSPTRDSHRRQFGLTFGRYSSWVSASFGSPPDQEVAVIPIPYAEALTPLRWPLLAHELGHWLMPNGRRPQDVAREEAATLAKTDDPPAWLIGAVEEVLADRIAERACGMAYGLSLAREAHLASLAHHAQVHPVAPSVTARLAVLDGGPELIQALPVEWRLPPAKSEQEEPLLRARARALELLPTSDELAPRPRVVEAAQALLASGQPASGVRLSPPLDQEQLESLRPGLADEAAVRGAFASATDTACRDSELLEAAWRNDVLTPPMQVVEELAVPLLNAERGLDIPRVGNAVAAVLKSDTALSRSLQAAAVHAWLVKWDTTIQSNVAGGGCT